MLFFVSILPILSAVFMMIVLKFPAKKALPITLIIAGLVVFNFYNMDLYHIMGYSLFGFLKSFNILIIIFGAFLIFSATVASLSLFANEVPPYLWTTNI